MLVPAVAAPAAQDARSDPPRPQADGPDQLAVARTRLIVARRALTCWRAERDAARDQLSQLRQLERAARQRLDGLAQGLWPVLWGQTPNPGLSLSRLVRAERALTRAQAGLQEANARRLRAQRGLSGAQAELIAARRALTAARSR